MNETDIPKCAECQKLREQNERYRAALINCKMQFADMLCRVKAPDVWMLEELNEALAAAEKVGE